MAYKSVWNKIVPPARQRSSVPGPKKSADDILKLLPQKTAPLNVPRDAARQAKLPGKRISKSGNEYWETRGNRSDALGKKL